jgi:D-cysteine desulfhydrase
MSTSSAKRRLPLFERYPGLERQVARLALAELPTPVRPLPRLGAAIGATDVHLKDDGLSGRSYGGNKVRKLEFLLADALERGAHEVVTFGFAGSNHAAATALYARDVGLRATSILLPQPNASYVRRNLLLGLSAGAELRAVSTGALAAAAAAARVLGRRIHGAAPPYMIPPGGSSRLGVIGHLNAALELDEQISRGELPEPERIYVALGSGGTAAGLLMGLVLAGLPTTVVAVRVARARWASATHVAHLFGRTAAWLRRLSPSFPPLELPPSRLAVRGELVGPGYAHFTRAGADAVELARAHEQLALEGTYTGKALAALIADAGSGRLGSGSVLFWNTHNARDVTARVAGVDYTALPRRLRRYFETDVQELDPERRAGQVARTK